MRAQWTEASSYRAVSSWLRLSTSHQNRIDLIAGQDDGMALGVVEAVKAAGKASQISVIGTDGMVCFDESHHRMLERYERLTATQTTNYPDVAESPSVYGHPVGHLLESVRAFADAVTCDEPVPVSAADGLAAARIVAAIHQSARSKQPVNLEIPSLESQRQWSTTALVSV